MGGNHQESEPGLLQAVCTQHGLRLLSPGLELLRNQAIPSASKCNVLLGMPSRQSHNTPHGCFLQAQYAQFSAGLSVTSKRHSATVVGCFLAELYAQFSGGKNTPAAAAAAAAWDALDDTQRSHAVQLADALSAVPVLQQWDSRLTSRLSQIFERQELERLLLAVDCNSQQLPKAYEECMSRAKSLLLTGDKDMPAAVAQLQPASIVSALEALQGRVADLSEQHRKADRNYKDWRGKAKSAQQREQAALARAQKAEEGEQSALARAQRAEEGEQRALARALNACDDSDDDLPLSAKFAKRPRT